MLAGLHLRQTTKEHFGKNEVDLQSHFAAVLHIINRNVGANASNKEP
jgi:hypothetical protein